MQVNGVNWVAVAFGFGLILLAWFRGTLFGRWRGVVGVFGGVSVGFAMIAFPEHQPAWHHALFYLAILGSLHVTQLERRANKRQIPNGNL
jgi:hypothetical protein